MKNKIINTLAIVTFGSLLFSEIALAKQTPYTPDDFYGGWHPELAGF